MDGPGFLDGLVGSLSAPLSGGYSRLAPEIQRLFSIVVGLNLIMAAVMWAAAHLELFQRWAMALVSLYVWVMIFTSYPVLITAFKEYCIEAGLLAAGAGGGLTSAEFQSPSTVMMKGFEATAPINKFIQNHTGMAVLKNLPNLMMMSLGALGLWLAFVVMAVHLVFVQAMMDVVVAFGFAFIIFGALGITNFLAERAFGLIVASAARLGVAALWTGLAFPFIDQFFMTPGQDPNVAVGAWILVGAWIIAIFSVIFPSIAHSFFAGGPVLSLGNLVPGMGMIRGGGGSAGGGSSNHGSSRSAASAPSAADNALAFETWRQQSNRSRIRQQESV